MAQEIDWTNLAWGLGPPVLGALALLWMGRDKDPALAAAGVGALDVSPLAKWRHRDAAAYAGKMAKVFGPPVELTPSHALWRGIEGTRSVVVANEPIAHTSSSAHRDFVYSTVFMRVPTDLLDDLARVSSSIIVDPLKGTVTARCGSLVANAVTLGFVRDVARGRTAPTKAEYARRMRGRLVPLDISFSDRMDEGMARLTRATSARVEVGRIRPDPNNFAHLYIEAMRQQDPATFEDNWRTLITGNSQVQNEAALELVTIRKRLGLKRGEFLAQLRKGMKTWPR